MARAPRRFWHVGPIARSVRDIKLAFSQLAGPDGQDAFASGAVQFDTSSIRQPDHPLRVGWMVGPCFGPVDPEVAAIVKAAAEALKDIGVFVEQVRIPALERDFALDVFNRLHVMEMKPAFAEVWQKQGRAANQRADRWQMTCVDDYPSCRLIARSCQPGTWPLPQSLTTKGYRPLLFLGRCINHQSGPGYEPLTESLYIQ